MKILSMVMFIIGLSAIVGGYGLIFTDWFAGIPLQSIEPFNSFVLPGLILAIVVGGVHVIAACMLWRRSKYMIEATAIAGFTMVIWLFSEVYIMSNETHLVQAIYFVIAITTLVSAFVLYRLGLYYKK